MLDCLDQICKLPLLRPIGDPRCEVHCADEGAQGRHCQKCRYHFCCVLMGCKRSGDLNLYFCKTDDSILHVYALHDNVTMFCQFVRRHVHFDFIYIVLTVALLRVSS